MTDHQPLDKDRTSRVWILKAVGIAFGLAVVGVAIITAVLMVVESPPARGSAVLAAPLDPASAPNTLQNTASDTSAAGAPVLVAGPTETLEASPTIEPTSTSTPSPTATAEATATPTSTPVAPTETPAPTRSSTTVRSAVQSASLQPNATPTPLRPLDMSFYVKAYCHKSTDNLQVVDLFLTAHGGVPPYDYYNDTTLIGHDAGMIRYTMKASSGNPVPYKIIILDSRGQRYVNEFFYKTGVSCKASPG